MSPSSLKCVVQFIWLFKVAMQLWSIQNGKEGVCHAFCLG